MVANANAGLRFLDRATPELEEARDTLKRIVRDGHRAGKVIGEFGMVDLDELLAVIKTDLAELFRSKNAELRILTEGDVVVEAFSWSHDAQRADQVAVIMATPTRFADVYFSSGSSLRRVTHVNPQAEAEYLSRFLPPELHARGAPGRETALAQLRHAAQQTEKIFIAVLVGWTNAANACEIRGSFSSA